MPVGGSLGARRRGVQGGTSPLLGHDGVCLDPHMGERAWIPGRSFGPGSMFVAGCSTPTDHVSQNPPPVASPTACKRAAGENMAVQPVELVVVERAGDSSAANRYPDEFRDPQPVLRP